MIAKKTKEYMSKAFSIHEEMETAIADIATKYAKNEGDLVVDEALLMAALDSVKVVIAKSINDQRLDLLARLPDDLRSLFDDAHIAVSIITKRIVTNGRPDITQ